MTPLQYIDNNSHKYAIEWCNNGAVSGTETEVLQLMQDYADEVLTNKGYTIQAILQSNWSDKEKLSRIKQLIK